ELGRGVEIDLATERDDVRLGAELLGVDIEVHARIIPPEVARGPAGRLRRSLSAWVARQSRYLSFATQEPPSCLQIAAICLRPGESGLSWTYRCKALSSAFVSLTSCAAV